MKSFFCLLLFIGGVSTAQATVVKKGYCYDQAVKYRDLMHKLVISDLKSKSKLVEGEKTFVYTPDRYALDNLEEVYTFTIPIGKTKDSLSDFTYTVTVEAWLNTDNTSSSCDVISFSHNKMSH